MVKQETNSRVQGSFDIAFLPLSHPRHHQKSEIFLQHFSVCVPFYYI